MRVNGSQHHHTRAYWLVRETLFKWNADNCLRLGASLSYYTLFSLFPLILVSLAIVGTLFANSNAARELILDGLRSVTGGFRDEFQSALEAAVQRRRGSGIAGMLLLLLGASWVFGELVSAFNIIWGVQAPSRGGPFHFFRATVFSFALVLAGAFLLLVSMIISAALKVLGGYLTQLPGGTVAWTIVHGLISLLVLALIFALLFRFVPQTVVAWRDVWLGAILTAILWTALQYGIASYIAYSRYESYGAIGATLALVAWVYLSSQVLFLGGEFTTVYAQHFGSRSQHSGEAAQHALATGMAPIEQSYQPPPRSDGMRISSAAAGVTVGVLGTLGITVLALALSLNRLLRRWFTK